jgi:hypothetical protein
MANSKSVTPLSLHLKITPAILVRQGISEESAVSLAQYMVSWKISETIVECIGLFTLSDLI